jgi:hypothetical protein
MSLPSGAKSRAIPDDESTVPDLPGLRWTKLIWSVTARGRVEECTVMNGKVLRTRRGIRRNLWVNAGVLLLLLFATLLGVTQALILLTVYALVILPS